MLRRFRENQYFEYGYAYAGFYVLGYCVWIHERVKAKGIEKLLFLSRDGDILQKVYQKLYPQEKTELRLLVPGLPLPV